MNRIYKFIMLIVGILIIVNTTVSFLFDHKWADLINSISGLCLFYSELIILLKGKRVKRKYNISKFENYHPINLMFIL